MLSKLKTKVKFARVFKLTLPVAQIEEPEWDPVLLSAKDVRGLDDRLSYHVVVPTEERLRAGDRCYAMLTEAGEVGSFTWVASGREVYVYELGESVWVPNNVAYFYDAFTFPEARGVGLIAETTRGIVADLENSHVERCEAWIVQRNTPSLRAYRKAGFQVYGSWRVTSVGPVRLCTGEPWIGGREQA
jgi:hypothetical protein